MKVEYNGKKYYGSCKIIKEEDNNCCPTSYGYCEKCPNLCLKAMDLEILPDAIAKPIIAQLVK